MEHDRNDRLGGDVLTSRHLVQHLTLVAFAAFAAFTASCSGVLDPAHNDAVNALGGEAPGVRTGPLHRPGQPCLTCHGGDGPGPDFAVAGTVYETRGGTTPLPGAFVVMTDASGETRRSLTNSAGNFYINASEWNPAFPMRVGLVYDNETKDMNTRIGRNGGCGECHQGAGSSTKMPFVYLREAQP
jgi:hypothetical protein